MTIQPPRCVDLGLSVPVKCLYIGGTNTHGGAWTISSVPFLADDAGDAL